MPSVCVVIAAYNAQATVARAVASALAEPEAVEIVVVDDASADETIARAAAADDGSGRLKLLRQPVNAGPAAARNRAIAETSSPWIALLDADDFFLLGRMKTLLAFSDEADMIADDMRQVSEEAPNEKEKTLISGALAAPRRIGFSEFVLSNVTRRGRDRGELGFLKPLMRREFLDRHGLRYREPMRLGEDFELYARALGHGARLLLTPEQGYVSVMRKGSLSGRHSIQDLLRLRDCDAALAAELPLSAAEKAALRRHYLSVDCRLQWRLLIEAVKKRDAAAALKTFLRPFPVPFYLCRQLAGEAWTRVKGRKP